MRLIVVVLFIASILLGLIGVQQSILRRDPSTAFTVLMGRYDGDSGTEFVATSPHGVTLQHLPFQAPPYYVVDYASDGDWILVQRSDEQASRASFYRYDLHSHDLNLIYQSQYTYILTTLSPSDTHIAMLRYNAEAGSYEIIVQSLQDGDQPISTIPAPGGSRVTWAAESSSPTLVLNSNREIVYYDTLSNTQTTIDNTSNVMWMHDVSSDNRYVIATVRPTSQQSSGFEIALLSARDMLIQEILPIPSDVSQVRFAPTHNAIYYTVNVRNLTFTSHYLSLSDGRIYDLESNVPSNVVVAMSPVVDEPINTPLLLLAALILCTCNIWLAMRI